MLAGSNGIRNSQCAVNCVQNINRLHFITLFPGCMKNLKTEILTAIRKQLALLWLTPVGAHVAGLLWGMLQLIRS